MKFKIAIISFTLLFSTLSQANEETCKEKVRIANEAFNSEDLNDLLDKATVAVKECEKAKVRSSPAYVVRGSAYLKLRKTANALSDFKKASAIDPKSEVIQINLCSAYAELKDVKNAKKECKKSMNGSAFKEQAKKILSQVTGS